MVKTHIAGKLRRFKDIDGQLIILRTIGKQDTSSRASFNMW